MNQEPQSTISSVQFALRPYSVKQLSELYGVSSKTFRRWLKPFLEAIGEKLGYYYNISQVRFIVQKLGVPGNVMVD